MAKPFIVSLVSTSVFLQNPWFSMIFLPWRCPNPAGNTGGWRVPAALRHSSKSFWSSSNSFSNSFQPAHPAPPLSLSPRTIWVVPSIVAYKPTHWDPSSAHRDSWSRSSVWPAQHSSERTHHSPTRRSPIQPASGGHHGHSHGSPV